MSIITTTLIFWHNRDDSLNIELNTHIPESLHTVVLVFLWSLTCNHQSKGVSIISRVVLLEWRFDKVGIAVCIIIHIVHHELSFLINFSSFMIIHVQDYGCLRKRLSLFRLGLPIVVSVILFSRLGLNIQMVKSLNDIFVFRSTIFFEQVPFFFGPVSPILFINN